MNITSLQAIVNIMLQKKTDDVKQKGREINIDFDEKALTNDFYSNIIIV